MIKIPFSLQKHDYVFVRGLISRHSKQAMVNFLLDTGASVTMIDPDIMRSIGYTEHCEEYLKPATVSSPAGKERGYRVRSQKLFINSIESMLTNIDIVCIRPERDVEALLGINFLKHFHYCIDHKRHVLTLQKN